MFLRLQLLNRIGAWPAVGSVVSYPAAGTNPRSEFGSASHRDRREVTFVQGVLLQMVVFLVLQGVVTAFDPFASDFVQSQLVILLYHNVFGGFAESLSGLRQYFGFRVLCGSILPPGRRSLKRSPRRSCKSVSCSPSCFSPLAQ
jgi:hypothetical protein